MSNEQGAKPFEEQQRRLAAEGGTDVERFVLQFLGILFGVVILEGLVLAASVPHPFPALSCLAILIDEGVTRR